MKKSTSVSIGFMVVGSWLASSVALAGPPPEPPRAGGIPNCEENLLICDTDLTQCAIDLTICEATAAGQAFPATGQTTCWDSNGIEIPCDGTGHDGDIQAGADLSYTDTGLTIIDNNTKLEWMKQDDNNGDCGSYPGYLDKDCGFSWDEAFAFVAELNTQPCFADHCDWRVPNQKELQSIVNYENLNPAVSAEFDTECVVGCVVEVCSCTAVVNGYWSSTSFVESRILAWGILYDWGFEFVGNKSFGLHVRAVRGGL